jgi:type IV secretory pathway VirJ component
MRWHRVIVAGLLLLFACSPDETMDGGRFGRVRVVKPSGDDRGIVVLFSDAAGWTSVDDAAAQALARDGAVVIGVDTKTYLRNLAQSTDERLYLVNDVFDLSQQLQREMGASTYLIPTLAGLGAGGTLAELILAQAPPATLEGAISIDPSARVDLAHPLAAEPPARPRYHEDLQPDAVATLPGFWSVGLMQSAPAAGRARVERLHQDGMAIDIRELPSRTTPAEALASLMAPHLRAAAPKQSLEPSLPLVELPVARPSDLMAIMLSGDGGWADIDRTISEDLQRDGVPVVGWDSLKYFWARKTPEETAKDLASVMTTYMQRWHASKVVLIGYSLGADVLPFAYNGLPEALQQQVVLVALLAIEKKADFQVTVGGWLQLQPGDDALPTAPAIAKMPRERVQCFYGVEEKHSVCPDVADTGITIVKLAGAHHFDGNYKALEEQIMAAARKSPQEAQSSTSPPAASP